MKTSITYNQANAAPYQVEKGTLVITCSSYEKSIKIVKLLTLFDNKELCTMIHELRENESSKVYETIFNKGRKVYIAGGYLINTFKAYLV